jgi:hypothetical protein
MPAWRAGWCRRRRPHTNGWRWAFQYLVASHTAAAAIVGIPDALRDCQPLRKRPACPSPTPAGPPASPARASHWMRSAVGIPGQQEQEQEQTGQQRTHACPLARPSARRSSVSTRHRQHLCALPNTLFVVSDWSPACLNLAFQRWSQVPTRPAAPDITLGRRAARALPSDGTLQTSGAPRPRRGACVRANAT